MASADMNDRADENKAEIYEAMAAMNRGFAQITAALYALESKGVLRDDYAFRQEFPIRELVRPDQLPCPGQR